MSLHYTRSVMTSIMVNYFIKENGTEIGNYFRDSIISDIEALFIYAGIHSKKFGFYRMPAKRFPCASNNPSKNRPI